MEQRKADRGQTASQIRTRLQVEDRTRDLAIFNLAIDSKLLRPPLATLKNAKILVQRDDAPDPSFEFHHALLRDTAYQTLLRSEGERLHLRLANLVESPGYTFQEATPELLAMHFSLGSNYRSAIDPSS